MHRIALIASAGVVAAVFSASGLTDTKPTAISGVVFDGANKPLPGVTVILSPHSRKDSTSRCVSGKGGEYTLLGKPSAAYNVSFQMTGYRPCVLESLHETGSHRVNVAMYKVADRMTSVAAHRYLQGVRSALFQSLALPRAQRARFLASFDEEGRDKHYLAISEKIILSDKISGEMSDYLQREQNRLKQEIERATSDAK